MRTSPITAFSLVISFLASNFVAASAFCPSNSASPSARSEMQPPATADHEVSRRSLFAGAAMAFGAIAMTPESAQASYSAYSRREQDWQERSSKGEIQVKTARDLRAELAEIVPQNSEGSKIFCPNGPSAAVSPLMENKCGDRQAIPSVYGRTEDVVGNSIPGFNGGRYTAQMRGDSTSLNAELGNVAYGFAIEGK